MDDTIIFKRIKIVVFDAFFYEKQGQQYFANKPYFADKPYQKDTLLMSQNGFTLVEVLIALLILGLATSLVVFNLPPSSQNIRREAQRFEARLSAASSEAVTSGEIIGLDVASDQYSFLQYQNGVWTPLEGRVFSTWTLDHDITLTVDILETDTLRENDKIISGGGSIIRTVNNVQSNDGEGGALKAPIIQFNPIGDNTEFSVRFTGAPQSWLVSHSVAGVIKVSLIGEGA